MTHAVYRVTDFPNMPLNTTSFAAILATRISYTSTNYHFSNSTNYDFDWLTNVTDWMNATERDCINEKFKGKIEIPVEPDFVYISVEVFTAILAIFFNACIVFIYAKNPKVRRSVANNYIISLALADLFVGLLGIPAAVLTSVGLPKNFRLCLISTSLLLQICTTSIFNLVTVTIDRYFAIIKPLRYQSVMNRNKVRYIITSCWIFGFLIGFLPLMVFHRGPPPQPRCFFMEVNRLEYLVFLFFATIVLPSAFMAWAYSEIYTEIRKQLEKVPMPSAHQILIRRNSKCQSNPLLACRHSSASLSPLPPSWKWKSELKVCRILVLIVTAFMLSWAPLYLLNTVLYFVPCLNVPPSFFKAFICLSHLNSVWNPLIYALGTKDFKKAIYKLVKKERVSF